VKDDVEKTKDEIQKTSTAGLKATNHSFELVTKAPQAIVSEIAAADELRAPRVKRLRRSLSSVVKFRYSWDTGPDFGRIPAARRLAFFGHIADMSAKGAELIFSAFCKRLFLLDNLVAGVGFEPTTFRL
jgi:hypothetical protein